ncbi:hypothetical protein AB1Y20_010627 [Prymnesium parvum]|uniref:TLC domain-containing protein n=1 Tax=Prymnesium parvum TaxID=97485 RepID=A0AB34ISR3_PRYPA
MLLLVGCVSSLLLPTPRACAPCPTPSLARCHGLSIVHTTPKELTGVFRRAEFPRMGIALPSCSASGVLSTAVRAGCIGVLAQLGLFAAFKRASDPVLSRAPGYSAHSAVAFVLMVFSAAFGLIGWLNPPATAGTAAGRLLVESNSARWLAATLLGFLIAWDIPTCLHIQRLRKPDMLGHHIAMTVTAIVGAVYLPTHYGLYYMGVVELSSIPMTAYDQYERAADVVSSLEDISPQRLQRVRSIRDGLKGITAVAFVLVRAIDFTRVTLSKFLPDAVQVLRAPSTAASYYLPLQFMIVSSACFAALQLYWFSMFVRISLTQRAREQRKKKRSGNRDT